jgi:formylmethanofuran dehydrogenase subunit E
VETLTIDPWTVDLDGLIDRGILLHGHRGPFLIAGIRMGLLALELLGNSGYFGLEAESETGTVTPLSCLTAGVQIGSGCTLGKGNIRVTDARRARVHFLDKSGRRVTIELRSKIYEGFLNGGLEEQSKVARDKTQQELFIWEPLQ